MKLRVVVPVLAGLLVAAALPASACDHNKSQTSATAAGMGSCSAHSTAWAGAWLERTGSGGLTVAAVAEGSPAARSGLKKGDVLLAVNGHELATASAGHSCAAGASCSIGSSFTYTVQRGKSTKVVKVQLEKMPAEASTRFAAREAAFEPALAAMVIPSID